MVDSSAWMEFLVDGPNASMFAAAIENAANLVVPSICVLEVFKASARLGTEQDALRAVSLMEQGTIVDLDGALAIAAAVVGHEYKLPLADSVVYATAERVGGVVWTQDEDFDGLASVRYFPKHGSR